MKKAILIIIITVALIISVCVALFAFFHLGGEGRKAPILSPFFNNATEKSYGEITAKLKDGYNYDLSGAKYWECPYCDCCEEGWCDWHCEAAYDLGFDVSCGCESNSLSLFDYATFTFPETRPIEEVYHDSIHFNKDEVFDVYVHIAKKLTDKEKLEDSEIIELANYYKKLSESINVYQQANCEYIDSLPEMPELYGDMRDDLKKLLYDRKLIISLSYLHEDLAEYLVENCVEMTGTCPLEDLLVICDQVSPEDSVFYVFSDQGHFYFCLSISVTANDWSSCVSHITNPPSMFSQKQISEMLKKAVKITDVEAEIPVYPD